ncbi:hypothetical protein BCR33DRAFT_725598 [Rhizoclosmatium globosum]|uniref:Uncharacterized protein n=1 Tax=Rhizoclosmatium globosum TaxID=329046 RepID=A0A1Y2AXI9_9FUNG|nr:hypothetical protein BCR33DRAFT_725598 [Rhizoclosmatium globosum]|eukprot:ORY27281.1 hypothetical protein BCR33DRAFT_725598 [Rhizoclosmatium globosum]
MPSLVMCNLAVKYNSRHCSEEESRVAVSSNQRLRDNHNTTNHGITESSFQQ